MSQKHPRAIIDDGLMSIFQWFAILVTVGLNAMDGFDVLSISFAAPGIAAQWGVDKATLGWVLSSELLGMALGSIVLGGVADKFGRRPTLLGCLFGMTAGMWGAAHAVGVLGLLAWRLMTGLGIGGVLATINALAAEFSNRRWRSLAMSLMVIGYPIGGVCGGLVVQHLFGSGGSWRDVFVFGAISTAVFIPLTWFLLPESVAYLDRTRGPGALAKINATLRRFGHPTVSCFFEANEPVSRHSVLDIFRPGLLLTTLLVTLAYFAHIISFYFVLKWVPKIIVDMGFAAKSAAGVLTWLNVGGATGGAIFGLLTPRVGLRRLLIITLLFASTMIMVFGHGSASIATLTVMVTIAGLFNNAAIVGLYMLFATVFPTHLRAFGTGFAIGLGRGGAALAPVIAGYLFQAGSTLQTVAVVMAMGSIISAISLLFLTVRHAD